jgi:hypothetical protein
MGGNRPCSRPGNREKNKNREPIPPGGIDSRRGFDLHFSFATSQGSFKGTRSFSGSVGRGRLPVFTPTGAVLDDPIRQCLLKTDVTPGFFRLDPFVFEDFFPFRLKFTVQGRIFQQIIRRR